MAKSNVIVDFKKLFKIFKDAKDYYLAADIGKLLKADDAHWVVNTYPGINSKKKAAGKAIVNEFKTLLLGHKVVPKEVYPGLLKEKYKSEAGCWATEESFTELITAAEKSRSEIINAAVLVKADNVMRALAELSYDKTINRTERAAIRASSLGSSSSAPPPYPDPTIDPVTESGVTAEGETLLMAYAARIRGMLDDIPEWATDDDRLVIAELSTLLPALGSVSLINQAVKERLASSAMELENGKLVRKLVDVDDDNGDGNEEEDLEGEGIGDLNTLPATQRYVNTSLVLRQFWSMLEHTKFDIMQKGVAIYECDCDVKNVYYFMTENGLDNTEIRDVAYAVIIVKLASVGLITSNRDGVAPELPLNANVGQLTTRKIGILSPLAKTMAIVALHAYSQGINDDVIPWFNSFCAVKGTFLTETRFSSIAKMVIYSQKFSEILDLITVGDIISENNVFKYRLTRLSTPALVKKALEVMPFGVLYEKFKVAEVREYARFERGGILAQIAAGPLAPYCLGETDPLITSNIPSNLTLSSLKAIAKPPYYPDTIRKAKMILDIMKFDYGKWYQGEKAMKEMSSDDFVFHSLVKAVATSMKEKTGEVDFEVEAYSNYSRVSDTVKERDMKKILTEWV